MINEIQVATADSAANEFVELFNSCATPVALTGHKLVYRAASGTNDVLLVTFASGTVLAGKSFMVLGGTAFPGTAFASLGGGQNGQLAALAGGVALRGPSDVLVDSVGYGNASNAFVEGTACGAPTLGTSIGRVPDGSDTNDNFHDFVGTTSTPGAANH